MFPFTDQANIRFPGARTLEEIRDPFFANLTSVAEVERSRLSSRRVEFRRNGEKMEFTSFGDRGFVTSEGSLEISADREGTVISYRNRMNNINSILFLAVVFIGTLYYFRSSLGLAILIVFLQILAFGFFLTLDYVKERNRLTRIIKEACIKIGV